MRCVEFSQKNNHRSTYTYANTLTLFFVFRIGFIIKLGIVSSKPYDSFYERLNNRFIAFIQVKQKNVFLLFAFVFVFSKKKHVTTPNLP